MNRRIGWFLPIAFWATSFFMGAVFVSAAVGPFGQESSKPEPTRDGRPAPQRVEIAGVDNAFRLSPRLYSGAQPEGAESFAALQKLGVKTIVTVDGAMPDVETAHRFGLRYVHLPVGYDGIPRDQALRIIKAARTLSGPLFVHCHHGKHRGPTAAALVGLASEGWSQDDATAWLKAAGTSPDYRGLFATVAGFQPPTRADLDAAGTDFPEQARPSSFIASMVAIDERWDALKAVHASGDKPPASHPDIAPPHEALQLAEQFKELVRDPVSKDHGADFVARAEASARAAIALRDAFLRHAASPSDATKSAAAAAFDAVGKSCTSCHARHRDNARTVR